VTERAADFARELVLDGFAGGVVPFEVVVAAGEVDVFFVENSCPLEGCSMLHLTSSAMAQLGVQWLISVQLILDLPAMAVGLILDIKALLLIVNPVGRALLPFTDALGAVALVLGLVAGHSVDVGCTNGSDVSG